MPRTKWLRGEELRVSRTSTRDHERDAWICREYQDGRTMRSIGDELGISKARVSVILQRMEFKTRTLKDYPRKRVTHTCPICGNQRQLQPSVAKRSITCSNKCGGCLVRKWSREDLIEHMVFLAGELGRTPGLADLNQHSPPDHMTFVRHFGSIREAQMAAGLEPRKRGAAGHARNLEDT